MAEQDRLGAERQQQITEQFRKAQERYQREAQFAESLPASNVPKFVSITDMARQTQEQTFAEATTEPSDFINRICGPEATSHLGHHGKAGWTK